MVLRSIFFVLLNCNLIALFTKCDLSLQSESDNIIKRAIIEVKLIKSETLEASKLSVNNSFNETKLVLHATYLPYGSISSSSGHLLQIHPLGLCNSFTDPLLAAEWIAVVRLDFMYDASYQCNNLYDKAKRAIERGATAVIYTTRNVEMSRNKLLNSVFKEPLNRPVLLLEGLAAYRLQMLLEKLVYIPQSYGKKVQKNMADQMYKSQWPYLNSIPNGLIRYHESRSVVKFQQVQSKALLEVVIFLSFFLIFCVICTIIVIKLRRKQHGRESTLLSLTKEVMAKLETRLYRTPCVSNNSYVGVEVLQIERNPLKRESKLRDNCTICLEQFARGEELRIMPCKHEYHKICIDPWLLLHRTCPLCMLDILKYPNSDILQQWNENRVRKGVNTDPAKNSEAEFFLNQNTDSLNKCFYQNAVVIKNSTIHLSFHDDEENIINQKSCMQIPTGYQNFNYQSLCQHDRQDFQTHDFQKEFLKMPYLIKDTCSECQVKWSKNNSYKHHLVGKKLNKEFETIAQASSLLSHNRSNDETKVTFATINQFQKMIPDEFNIYESAVSSTCDANHNVDK